MGSVGRGGVECVTLSTFQITSHCSVVMSQYLLANLVHTIKEEMSEEREYQAMHNNRTQLDMFPDVKVLLFLDQDRLFYRIASEVLLQHQQNEGVRAMSDGNIDRHVEVEQNIREEYTEVMCNLVAEAA